METYAAQRNKTRTKSSGSARSARDVERAYEEAKDRFSRDVLPASGAPALELAVIESRYVEAYHPVQRARRSRSAHDGRAAREPHGMETSSFASRWTDQDEGRDRGARRLLLLSGQKFMLKATVPRDPVRKAGDQLRPNDARFYFLLAECQAKNPDPTGNGWPANPASPRWTSGHQYRTLGRFYNVQVASAEAVREALWLIHHERPRADSLSPIADWPFTILDRETPCNPRFLETPCS